MKVDWDFTAQMFFDQIPKPEQARVVRAVEQAAKAWRQKNDDLRKLSDTPNDDGALLYSLHASMNSTVLLAATTDRITVVDILLRGQVDGLQSMQRSHQGLTG